MKYARHGHSACSLGDKYIVVTGSRKDVQNAPYRTEIYDVDANRWYELGDMNHGRHYHSSCSFEDGWIYVFCGIS